MITVISDTVRELLAKSQKILGKLEHIQCIMYVRSIGYFDDECQRMKSNRRRLSDLQARYPRGKPSFSSSWLELRFMSSIHHQIIFAEFDIVSPPQSASKHVA